MNTPPTSGPGRLDHFVSERLAALRMTREDLAQRGGPSRSTLHKATSGARGLSRTTLARLDDALGWMAGSASAILDGGSPHPAAPLNSDARNVIRAADSIALELQGMVAQLRQLFDELSAERDAHHAG